MLIIKIIYHVHILTFYVNYTQTEPAKPKLVRTWCNGRSLPTFVHDIDYELKSIDCVEAFKTMTNQWSAAWERI